jgi:hypothetical protein
MELTPEVRGTSCGAIQSLLALICCLCVVGLAPMARAETRSTEGFDHWAYQKAQRPKAPSVRDSSWVRNDIDRFVLARLEAEGMQPSPEADRSTQLRRLHLDLIGLPPSPKELKRFLADKRPDAYERRVDELLSSPHYGERWATPWLDAGRYADNVDSKSTHEFAQAWPFRDWLIKALNADMPFTQLTIEMLAGDLLPHATLDQRIATGFHRGSPLNLEAGIDPEEVRVTQVIDRTNVTASVWLGTSLECAQCHDHNHDPFTQREYYEFFAFFNNTKLETRLKTPTATASYTSAGPWVTIPWTAKERVRNQRLHADRKKLKAEIERRTDELIADWRTTVPNSPGRKGPRLQALLAASSEPDAEALSLIRQFLVSNDPKVAKLKRALAQAHVPLKKMSMVMEELPEPRATHILDRGSFLAPTEEVGTGVPEVLHPMPADAPKNRLGLARWLVDPANPLVDRVFVNRTWANFFGKGLVATVADFGTRGDRPTHPLLLDWLASEFWELDTSIKQLDRLIVTSATYRQSSRVTDELLSADPENELYGRAPRTRLSAEFIRDQALFASGLLDRRISGIYVHPVQPRGLWHKRSYDPYYPESVGRDRYRRGIYTRWVRGVLYPSFANFDAPDRARSCLQRSQTTTPMQALTLLNDPVYVEASAALARRILDEQPSGDFARRIRLGFLLALSRSPTAREVETLKSFFGKELAAFEQQPDAAKRLLAPWESSRDMSAAHAAPLAERAAWLMVASVLLNLDEALHRG